MGVSPVQRGSEAPSSPPSPPPHEQSQGDANGAGSTSGSGTAPINSAAHSEPPRGPEAGSESESSGRLGQPPPGAIEEQDRLLADAHKADARVAEAELFADSVRSAPDESVRREARESVDQTKAGAEAARYFLSSSIQGEIQKAAEAQPVPSAAFVAQVTGDIRTRHPDDPVFQAAVDAAAHTAQRVWHDQGRTPEQLGAVLDAAAGDMGAAQKLAHDQLVAAAEQAQANLPPDATAVDRTNAAMREVTRRGFAYRAFGQTDPRLAGEAADAAFRGAMDEAIEGATAEAVNRVLTETSPSPFSFQSIAGKIWNLPNTAVGLAYGAAGGLIDQMIDTGTRGRVDTNFKVSLGPNMIQFENHPINTLFNSDIALGNTVSYARHATERAETSVPGVSVPSVQHELAHTYQGEMLGPGYLPANILAQVVSALANLQGLSPPGPDGSITHGPLNFMERGPLSVPPRPF